MGKTFGMIVCLSVNEFECVNLYYYHRYTSAKRSVLNLNFTLLQCLNDNLTLFLPQLEMTC